MLPFLSDEIKITRVNGAAGAGTTDVDSTAVDMAGWEGVLFVASFGTSAANNRIHAEQSDESNDNFAELDGSEVTPVGDHEPQQWVDVHRPEKRYVRCVADRGTSTTVEAIWAIQYRGRNKPTDASIVSDTIAGVQVASPDEAA